MQSTQDYFAFLADKLQACLDTQCEQIEQAASMILNSHRQGGNFYAFGSGHSHMIAEELYTRAGGLAFVKAILPPELMLHERVNKSTNLERLGGYAKALLDLYPITERDVFLIISNSGRNSVPVEMAIEAKKKGAYVIALTSLRHSKRVSSRQKEGKKLYEVADLVLDNQAGYGDAEFTLPSWPVPIAGTSDFTGIAMVQALTVTIAQKMVEEGEEPPIFRSANIDGAEEINRRLHEQYIAEVEKDRS